MTETVEAEIVETGEQDVTEAEEVTVMTAAEARERTDHLKRHLTNAWFELKELYVRSGWLALGFHSWDMFVKTEFGSIQLTPPADMRMEVMVGMRKAGMSTTAIGTATNLSPRTVRRELNKADLPEDLEVWGTDGKKYAPSRPTTQSEGTPVDQWRGANGLDDLTESNDDDANCGEIRTSFHGGEERWAPAQGGVQSGDEKRQDILSDAFDEEALRNEDPASLGVTPFVHDPNAVRAPRKRPVPDEVVGVQGELFTVAELTGAGTEVLRLAGLIQLSTADRSLMSAEQLERYRQEITQAAELLMDELDNVAETKP